MKDTDYWLQEEFEQAILTGMVTFFESEIKRKRNIGKESCISHESLTKARQSGFYCPSNSRLVLESGFDVVNDTLPTAGTLFLPCPPASSEITGYSTVHHIRMSDTLPRPFHRRSGGKLYESLFMCPSNEGEIDGARNFVSVDKEGTVHASEIRLQGNKGIVYQSVIEPYLLTQIEFNASTALQYLADERFCWRIEAIEKDAKVRIGCDRAEVKSLLYARQLPRTVTGRKRPILHLVSAHQRRMRSGVDIDIEEFLRGTREVVMDNTLFRVHPPVKYLRE